MEQANENENGLRDDPIGSGNWEVTRGECVASIAAASGHFWEKLWGLGENRDLKDGRKDANALLPGDFVEVPDIEPKEETGATEKRHRFRRKGVPSVIIVQVLRLGEPVADKPFKLDVDGGLIQGDTDSQGRIEEAILPDARHAKLVVDNDGEEICYDLELGGMDPLDTTPGIKARLKNLGFDPGRIDMEDRPEYRAALSSFQERYELEKTAEPDQATRDKLSELMQ
jgi:putative peptidoglycan binding protein